MFAVQRLCPLGCFVLCRQIRWQLQPSSQRNINSPDKWQPNKFNTPTSTIARHKTAPQAAPAAQLAKSRPSTCQFIQGATNQSAPRLLGKTPQRPHPAVSLSHLHPQHQGATMRTELDVPFSHKNKKPRRWAPNGTEPRRSGMYPAASTPSPLPSGCPALTDPTPRRRIYI